MPFLATPKPIRANKLTIFSLSSSIENKNRKKKEIAYYRRRRRAFYSKRMHKLLVIIVQSAFWFSKEKSFSYFSYVALSCAKPFLCTQHQNAFIVYCSSLFLENFLYTGGILLFSFTGPLCCRIFNVIRRAIWINSCILDIR